MHGDRIADCNPSKVKAEIDTPLIPGGAWTEDKKVSLAADGMCQCGYLFLASFFYI
jgi:hypothetical protein